jgi:serine/threonine protein kinase
VFGFGHLNSSGLLRFFIDMEVCDTDLETWIQRDRGIQAAQTYECSPGFQELQVWNIVRQIADGLVFIHEQKEIHRDLKPSNGNLIAFLYLLCLKTDAL